MSDYQDRFMFSIIDTILECLMRGKCSSLEIYSREKSAAVRKYRSCCGPRKMGSYWCIQFVYLCLIFLSFALSFLQVKMEGMICYIISRLVWRKEYIGCDSYTRFMRISEERANAFVTIHKYLQMLPFSVFIKCLKHESAGVEIKIDSFTLV